MMRDSARMHLLLQCGTSSRPEIPQPQEPRHFSTTHLATRKSLLSACVAALPVVPAHGKVLYHVSS